MASAKGKVVISSEVPEEIRTKLDKRAEDEHRKRSEIIYRAIRFYLEHAPVVPAQEDPIPEPKKGRQK